MLLVPPRLAIAPRDSGSGGALSKSTIIIIAVVCGSVVLLLFVLFLWRNLARSCRRSRKVPLPPVQDLAHHRGHSKHPAAAAAAATAASRPATWAVDEPMFHPRAYSAHFLSASASNASLLRSSPDLTSTSRSPTRETSWAVDDLPTAASADSSPFPTPPFIDDLRAPNPSYFAALAGASNSSSSSGNPHHSMASIASDAASDADASSSIAALPATPSELGASVESSASLLPHSSNGHAHAGYIPPARPRPPRASRSRSRPLSTVSSAGTVQTSHSMNTLRGPAHSIHSAIQIVLPAPLAPELYPNVRPTDDRISGYGFGFGASGGGAGGGSASRANSFYGGFGAVASGEGDRRSVADPWLSGSLAQSRTSMRIDREAGSSGSGSSSSRMSSGPRASSAARPRSSLSKMASASSLSDNASPRASAHRAQSQPAVPFPPAHYAPVPPRGPPSYPPSRAPSPGAASPPAGPSRPPSAPPGRSPPSPPPVPRIPPMHGQPLHPGPGPGPSMSYVPISQELSHPQPHPDLDLDPERGWPPREPPTPAPASAPGVGVGVAQSPVDTAEPAPAPARDPLLRILEAAGVSAPVGDAGAASTTSGHAWAGPTDPPAPPPLPPLAGSWSASSEVPREQGSGERRGEWEGRGRAQGQSARQPSKLRRQQRS
ncbi:hypothetical protein BD414DRAFT_506104 [Trametes punicea]|nr:hypothetical protein BD414DRAFT_506104 [Trametes punicea]